MLDVVAYARLECDYLVAMEMLRMFNPELAKWVEGNQPKHQCMCKFPKLRWDKMISNLAKSFNSWLRHEHHNNICVFSLSIWIRLDLFLMTTIAPCINGKGYSTPRLPRKLLQTLRRVKPTLRMCIQVVPSKSPLEEHTLMLILIVEVSLSKLGKCRESHVIMLVQQFVDLDQIFLITLSIALS